MASCEPLVTDAEKQAFDDISLEELEEESKGRTLLYASLAVVSYWALGFCYGAYCADWDVIDSVYFVVITMTTVGYGDLSFMDKSVSTRSRLFGGFYVFLGVAFVAVAMGIILDAVHAEADKLLDQMKREHQNTMSSPGGSRGKLKFDLKREVGKLYKDLLKHAASIFVTIAIGTAGMMYLEGWAADDAFYFCSVTMTTVGYGDMHPSNVSSKMFTVLFCLVSFSVLAASISALGAVPFKTRRLKNLARVLNQFGRSLNEQELRSVCLSPEVKVLQKTRKGADNSDLHVSRAEFVLWQLVKQNKIDMSEDVAPCLQTFDFLDRDGSGRLNHTDLVSAARSRDG